MKYRLLLTLLLASLLAVPTISLAEPSPKKVSTHVHLPHKAEGKTGKKKGKKPDKAHQPKKVKPGKGKPGLIVVNRNHPEHPMLFDALNSISFSGYDKRASSKQESIFITNSMPHHLKRVKVRLSYLDNRGRVLHSRDVVLECDVPPGQTRNVSFKTWDKQGNFFYVGGSVPRLANAIPFDITLEPIEYQFRP